MSTEFIRATVAEYLTANFTAATLQMENHDTVDLSERSDPYVDLHFRFTGNDQISMGDNSLTRRYGAVQTDIYVKNGQGSKISYQIAGALEALFSRVELSGIQFQVPVTLPPQDVAGWFRLTLRSPFYYDS